MLEINKFGINILILLLFSFFLIFFEKNNIESNKIYKYLKIRKNKKTFLKKFLEESTEETNQEDYLYEISIFDVFSNKQLSKLIRSISNLDDNKFNKELNYRSKLIGDYNYINSFNGMGGWAKIAEIIPEKEKHISKINIVKTQLNNKEIFVKFNLILNHKELSSFYKKMQN